MSDMKSVLSAYLGLSHASPEEQVLRLLVELGTQFVQADEGSLLILDENTKELVFAMTTGDDVSQEHLLGRRVPLGKGITGLAAQTHEVQIGSPTFGTGQETDPKSVLAAPMLIGDHLIGVITAVRLAGEKRFTSGDATLYARIATVAGVVVEQQQKLARIQSLQQATDARAPQNKDEEFRLQIAQDVAMLANAQPHTKQRVARMLHDLVAIAGLQTPR